MWGHHLFNNLADISRACGFLGKHRGNIFTRIISHLSLFQSVTLNYSSLAFGVYLTILWRKGIPTREIRGRGLKTPVVVVTSGAALTLLLEKIRCNYRLPKLINLPKL